MAGKTIVSDMNLSDGLSTRAYIQIDPETRQVITVPASLIENNLKLASDAFHLAQQEVTSIKNGKPLTFSIGNDPITIGVDLTDKKGIRICEGDDIEWKNQSKKEWGKYTFGCYGCWITDSDGNHDYISEEDYTEELWDEQKKAGQRNISSGLRK